VPRDPLILNSNSLPSDKIPYDLIFWKISCLSKTPLITPSRFKNWVIFFEVYETIPISSFENRTWSSPLGGKPMVDSTSINVDATEEANRTIVGDAMVLSGEARLD